jgi:Mrp family chromosome partitioning ATPase/capsular polysaccharide biosynthesis protein
MHALRTHALLVLAITVAAVIAGLAVVATATKRYDASAVLQIQALAQNGNDPFQGMDVFRQPADLSSPAVAAASLFGSRAYVDLAKQKLGKQSSSVSLSATPLSQADMVSLSATAPKAKLAKRAANTYAATVLTERNIAFGQELQNRIDLLRAQMRAVPGKYRRGNPVYQALAAQVGALNGFIGSSDPTLRRLSWATVPVSPSWPRPKLTILVALAIGLLLGIAAAVALELLNPRFTREDELIAAHRLPVLARMPRLPTRAARNYSLGRGPLPSEAWMAYRTLRAVLATAGRGGDRLPSSILVTSGGAGDGKTFTAVNLAIALSSSGLNVTLVDADIPRPMVATTFNVTGNRDGLVRLLRDPETAELNLIRAPRHQRLNLLLCSPEQIHQLHLFDSERMSRALARLQQVSDVVVVDSPPLPEVAEALALADAAETVLICVRIGHTRRDRLAELRDLLGRRGVTPLGLFVTDRKADRRKSPYGYPVDLPGISGDQLTARRDQLAASDAPTRRDRVASADV